MKIKNKFGNLMAVQQLDVKEKSGACKTQPMSLQSFQKNVSESILRHENADSTLQPGMADKKQEGNEKKLTEHTADLKGILVKEMGRES